jgi:hypothetical protein
MNVVRGDHIVQHRETITLLGFEHPAQIKPINSLKKVTLR